MPSEKIILFRINLTLSQIHYQITPKKIEVAKITESFLIFEVFEVIFENLSIFLCVYKNTILRFCDVATLNQTFYNSVLKIKLIYAKFEPPVTSSQN